MMSEKNSTTRIHYLAKNLVEIIDSSHESSFTELFVHICLQLSRCIDVAVFNNEIPPKAQELPDLLVKVFQHKTTEYLETYITVLMISVKAACRHRWFSNKDTEELLTHAKKIESRFGISGASISEPSQSLPIVVNIMSRFCPQIKIGQMLASLEVHSGDGTYLADFHISKNQSFSSDETLWLFVAETDNIETASCIIRPPQVSFLLNGMGVPQKKTKENILVTGPQFPTDVSQMCVLGANLLQVMGQFNGHYLIVIASMSVASTLETPVIQDYVLPEAVHSSDSEIIEGTSRITLNCPVSGKRIKIPVKGFSCKHLQCFDLDNYLNINMVNPFWRCPCCNQTISYLDIRIDQYMVKVLKEIEEDATHVIIFKDGSWKSASESNDHLGQQNGSEPRQPTTVFDLTNENDEIEIMTNSEIEDKKPSKEIPQNHPIATTIPSPSETNSTWSNLPNHFIDQTLNMNNANQTVNPNADRSMQSVPRQISYTTLNPSPNAERLKAISSHMQRQQQFCGTTLEPMQFLETGSSSSPNQPMTQQTRDHIQNDGGHPAQRQPQNQNLHQTQNQNLHYLQSQNLHQTQNQNFYYLQNQNLHQAQNQNLLYLQNQRLAQCYTSPPIVMIRPSPHLQNTQYQQEVVPPRPRIDNSMSSSSQNRFIAPSHQSRIQTQSNPVGFRSSVNEQSGNVGGGMMKPQLTTAGPLSSHPSQQSSRHIQAARTNVSNPVNTNVFRFSAGEHRANVGVQPVRTIGELLDVSSERNWRTTGQMRGSLRGQAYSDALGQFMSQPSQLTQVTGPTATHISVPHFFPLHNS